MLDRPRPAPELSGLTAVELDESCLEMPDVGGNDLCLDYRDRSTAHVVRSGGNAQGDR